ncbi:CpaD family pilus assembly protein [Novosphingobium sp. M1R2S20]|uniref:CpaD family pilus assembly protein n=1 Tax=Novosphingobium rhizovicinum TaxID=3228928 RepID=A0ABV3R7T5_9SPHN
MKHAILNRAPQAGVLALALMLGSTLAGCAGVPTNRSMNSIHQPVVEKVNYTLDIATGSGGLSYPEQQRLSGWFEGLGLRYGDRISILDATQSTATRSAIGKIASQYGMAVGDNVPATAGYVEPGVTRVVLTRTKAVVHGCPDWSAHSDANPQNGLSTNYGCAVNSNMAAMVANPEHLLRGDDSTGDTAIMSSNKAISTYRKKEPTGAAALKQTGTQEN